MQTIINDDGDTVTRINVMHVYSYDVEQITADLLEDNRATGNDGIVITLDDVLERIRDLAADEFRSDGGQFIYQGQNEFTGDQWIQMPSSCVAHWATYAKYGGE